MTEFNPGASKLIYSTYLGGSGVDTGISLAVDSFGEAFITGVTTSTDFPLSNALQATYAGGSSDALVAGFQAGGERLIYSTYLGGPGQDIGLGIAVDPGGDAWITGSTNSTTFPAAITRPEVVHRDVPPRRIVGAVRQPTDLAPAPGRPQGSPLQSTAGVTAALAGSIALDMARVHAAPEGIAFAAVVAGTTSAPETVTISNPGTAPLTFSAITASDSFTVPSGGSCSTSSPVAPGGSCTVNVAFAPTAGGSFTGTLTLTDNGIGSPHSVLLSGTGQDFTVSTDKTSASVTAGGTATFTLSVASQGGFNHSLDLSCDDPAPRSTCSINPASVTPNPASGATVFVSITTTAPSQVAPRVPNGPTPGPWDVRARHGVPLLLAMLALLAVAAVSDRRRSPPPAFAEGRLQRGPMDSRFRGNDIQPPCPCVPCPGARALAGSCLGGVWRGRTTRNACRHVHRHAQGIGHAGQPQPFDDGHADGEPVNRWQWGHAMACPYWLDGSPSLV